MTAGDLPITTGNPDQGFEGYRFVGYNLYDSLILWDLSEAATRRPTSSRASPPNGMSIEGNHKRWIFKLRQGVKWHDGCPFTADDVVWNMSHFDRREGAASSTRRSSRRRAPISTPTPACEKVDDLTVAFNTKAPDSLFPYNISYVLMISPCRAKEVKTTGPNTRCSPRVPAPTGSTSASPHQRMELVPNTDYWDKARVPKQDRLVLVPMPEASTRTAALLSGQVNWIEAPSPDAIDAAEIRRHDRSSPESLSAQLVLPAQLRQRPVHRQARAPGGELRAQPRGHEGAAERADARAATRPCTPSTPYYGKPVIYKYDPDKAKALLKEAGCLPCKVTFAISTSGSGQMQPLPMNELVKSQLDAAGFQVTLQTDGLERAAPGRTRRGRCQPRHQRDQCQPGRRRTRSTR